MRLYQGDYSQETVFSDDPVEVALQWQALGAPRLHIVDLDGAATGELGNWDIISQIAGGILVPTQLGGGIRQLETIKQIFRAGIDRAVLGTAAVENRSLIEEVCRNFGDSIIVGLDVRDGRVATRGWRQQTEIGVVEFARSLVQIGVRRFIYTDITRDGTLTEPNYSAIFELVDSLRVPVIAAGGISSLTHLRILKRLGVEGAIVGRALYTGNIKLKQALDVLANE